MFQMMASCFHCLEVSYFMALLAEKKFFLKARRLATILNLSILLAFTKIIQLDLMLRKALSTPWSFQLLMPLSAFVCIFLPDCFFCLHSDCDCGS